MNPTERCAACRARIVHLHLPSVADAQATYEYGLPLPREDTYWLDEGEGG